MVNIDVIATWSRGSSPSRSSSSNRIVSGDAGLRAAASGSKSSPSGIVGGDAGLHVAASRSSSSSRTSSRTSISRSSGGSSSSSSHVHVHTSGGGGSGGSRTRTAASRTGSRVTSESKSSGNSGGGGSSSGIIGSDAGLRVQSSNELASKNVEVRKSGHGGGSGAESPKPSAPTSHYFVDQKKAAEEVFSAVEKHDEEMRQKMKDTLSPTIAMVAKDQDVKTLLEGERRIHEEAEKGDVFAKIYEHGKAMALMAEDIMEGIQEKLPLEDKGPVIGGKTVGEQIENAIGMAAGAIPFLIGLGEQAVATAGLAAEGKYQGSAQEFLEKAGEYTIEGAKKQAEYVKEEPVGALLLFAAPEAKGVIETVVHPHRIPMHALVDVTLKSSTKRIPRETGRLEAYELIKQSLENKPVESEIAPEFKEPVREKTVYHATPDVSPFMKDVVEVQAPNAQGIHTGGLYVGPEIYEYFLSKRPKGGEYNPGALIIEHKGVSDYPAKIMEEVKEHPDVHPEPGKTFAHMTPENFREIWESLEPTKREVYLKAKEYVESTPGKLVVSPQSTSGIGYRQYEVEGIITPGTKLIRALNTRSKLARVVGSEKGEYFMKVGGKHVELLHFGMEFETTPYTLSELYKLKAQGAIEFAKNVGRTVKKPFERVRETLDEIRDFLGEDVTRKVERSERAEEIRRGRIEEIVDDVDRVAEELRRDFLEDVYRREIRRGMKRPWRAFDFGFDFEPRRETSRRNWREYLEDMWRDRGREPENGRGGRGGKGREPEERPGEREPEPDKRPPKEPPDEPDNPWPRIPPGEPPDIPDIPDIPRIPPPDEDEFETTRDRTKKFSDLYNFVQELNEMWSETYGYMELVHKFPTVEEMLFGKRGRGGLIL